MLKRKKFTKPTRETMSLEEFAQEHELTLVVGERSDEDVEWILNVQKRPGSWGFYAWLDGLFVLEDGWKLVGEHGNGDTEEEAVQDYARIISSRTGKYEDRYIDIPELFV